MKNGGLPVGPTLCITTAQGRCGRWNNFDPFVCLHFDVQPEIIILINSIIYYSIGIVYYTFV